MAKHHQSSVTKIDRWLVRRPVKRGFFSRANLLVVRFDQRPEHGGQDIVT
jgi:hypothetical protein